MLVICGDEDFRFGTNKQMNVIAFYTNVSWRNICVVKCFQFLISYRKKNVIAKQINNGQYTGRYNIGPKKSHIAHACIEHRHYLCVARKAGGKKDDRDQRKNGPQQSVDPGYEIEIVIKDDLFLGDRFFNKVLNMLTEVYSHCNNAKQQSRKEKRSEILPDDIIINSEQAVE